MKKIIVALCMVLTMSCFNIFTVNAEEYYYEETIEIIDEITIRATSTKTGKKTVSYKNANGEVLWSVAVQGTFTYTGSSSKCTNSEVITTVNNSNWKIISKSSSKTNNIAKATATAKNYFLGEVIATVTKNVSLTCSNTGVLS